MDRCPKCGGTTGLFFKEWQLWSVEYKWDGAEDGGECIGSKGGGMLYCRDCAHSRIERHTGDDRRVCWKRKSHGEVVPDDGFCHDGKEKEDG